MINKLSQKQIESMKSYVNKYINIGLNTDRVSKERVDDIVKDIYTVLLDRKEPNEIILLDSPLSAWKYIQNRIGKEISFVLPYLCGSFDSFIFAYYDFIINELNVNIDKETLKKYNVWKKTLELGYIYIFDDVCIVSQKPVEIKRNKDGQIHCENGPAIKYADGLSVYALNGVMVPKKIVETPWNKLDAKIILKETNAEIRREIVRKIGIEKVCKDLNAKVIDKQGDYELLVLDIGDGINRPYLKMKNPSIGIYHIEGVPRECDTVEKAIMSRRPKEMQKIPIDNINGEDYYQQGDVVIWNKNAKSIKLYPKILT